MPAAGVVIAAVPEERSHRRAGAFSGKLDHEMRAMACEEIVSTLEDFAFHPFDVDFDEESRGACAGGERTGLERCLVW